MNCLTDETRMGHIGIYRRMLIWGIGTLMALAGALKTFAFPATGVSFLLYLFLFVFGMIIIVINEVVFGLRKQQLEIDRDETIKTASKEHPHSPMILAICPNCKSRIPSESKYCLECGTDIQSETE